MVARKSFSKLFSTALNLRGVFSFLYNIFSFPPSVFFFFPFFLFSFSFSFIQACGAEKGVLLDLRSQGEAEQDKGKVRGRGRKLSDKGDGKARITIIGNERWVKRDKRII